MPVSEETIDTEFCREVGRCPQGETKWNCPILAPKETRTVTFKRQNKAVKHSEQVLFGLRLTVKQLALA